MHAHDIICEIPVINTLCHARDVIYIVKSFQCHLITTPNSLKPNLSYCPEHYIS